MINIARKINAIQLDRVLCQLSLHILQDSGSITMRKQTLIQSIYDFVYNVIYTYHKEMNLIKRKARQVNQIKINYMRK